MRLYRRLLEELGSRLLDFLLLPLSNCQNFFAYLLLCVLRETSTANAESRKDAEDRKDAKAISYFFSSGQRQSSAVTIESKRGCWSAVSSARI